MRALTSNDVKRIRELVDGLYEIAEDVGLDMEIDVRAGDMNRSAKIIEIVRANGYVELNDTRCIPGRVTIKTEHNNEVGDGDSYYMTTSNKLAEVFWIEGECNGHIAAVFEELRNETIDVDKPKYDDSEEESA